MEASPTSGALNARKRLLSQCYDESDREDSALRSLRRTARACLHCRARKQRCLPLQDDDGTVRLSCRRCHQLDITCSFEVERDSRSQATPTPTRVAELVVELQQRITSHEQRIEALEQRGPCHSSTPRVDDRMLVPGARSCPSAPSMQMGGSHQKPSPPFSMDRIDLDAPIATLRALGGIDSGHASAAPGSTAYPSVHLMFDPVARSIVSEVDAQKLVDLFFEHCHGMAVLLNRGLWRSVTDMRISDPLLLLAICSIGARFWPTDEHNTRSASLGFHPRYTDIVELLDKFISRLCLMPSLEDVNLQTIQVILLYAQWMPCQHDNEDRDNTSISRQKHPRSRYNDVSAYTILGLALRFAKVIDLEREATLPFQRQDKIASAADVDRLRIWNNLITCHYNLMLNSRFDAAVDPTHAASASRQMISHYAAQQPQDTRITALVELGVIVHRAEHGVLARLPLDGASLHKANAEFDEWERFWRPRLIETRSQHNSIPFTSFRWYRLAINSASLEPLLSSKRPADARPIQLWRLRSLEISLTAASQMLMALSAATPREVWTLDSQNAISFPSGPFTEDYTACKCLSYAVDSTWISLTFATAFLVLCYVRGAVDDDLNLCVLDPSTSLCNRAPLPPLGNSIIARLARLATAVFDAVCGGAPSHPARSFQSIVRNATSLILVDSDDLPAEFMDDLTTQSLANLMGEPGFEWPGNLFDASANFSVDVDGGLTMDMNS